MQDQPPLEFKLESDRIVVSTEDPKVKLRRVEGRFVSQRVFGKPLTHHLVMLIPTDQELLRAPERRGKVVIVGSTRYFPFHQSSLVNYGYPIATRLGYPTMILANPGSTPAPPGHEFSIADLWAEGVPRVVTNNYYFRLAIPYLRAMDVFADTLKIPRHEIKAVIGGHSQRAPSAYTAAASVVYLLERSEWLMNTCAPCLRSVYFGFAVVIAAWGRFSSKRFSVSPLDLLILLAVLVAPALQDLG